MMFHSTSLGHRPHVTDDSARVLRGFDHDIEGPGVCQRVYTGIGTHDISSAGSRLEPGGKRECERERDGALEGLLRGKRPRGGGGARGPFAPCPRQTRKDQNQDTGGFDTESL